VIPKSRQPREIWQETRRRVWERDGGSCQYPYGKHPVPLEEAQIDHIQSGKFGTNRMENLRTLCRYHHVLRLDSRHRGMIGKALEDGLIPPNWRDLLWEDKP
jgi:5-methylcytosine-specific restriction endonuclease McrA